MKLNPGPASQLMRALERRWQELPRAGKAFVFTYLLTVLYFAWVADLGAGLFIGAIWGSGVGIAIWLSDRVKRRRPPR